MILQWRMNQQDSHDAIAPNDLPEVPEISVLNAEFEAQRDADRAAAKAAFELLSPTDQAKYAMGWLHTARFLTTAAQLHHLPTYDLPEICLLYTSDAADE